MTETLSKEAGAADADAHAAKTAAVAGALWPAHASGDGMEGLLQAWLVGRFSRGGRPNVLLVGVTTTQLAAASFAFRARVAVVCSPAVAALHSDALVIGAVATADLLAGAVRAAAMLGRPIDVVIDASARPAIEKIRLHRELTRHGLVCGLYLFSTEGTAGATRLIDLARQIAMRGEASAPSIGFTPTAVWIEQRSGVGALVASLEIAEPRVSVARWLKWRLGSLDRGAGPDMDRDGEGARPIPDLTGVPRSVRRVVTDHGSGALNARLWPCFDGQLTDGDVVVLPKVYAPADDGVHATLADALSSIAALMAGVRPLMANGLAGDPAKPKYLDLGPSLRAQIGWITLFGDTAAVGRPPASGNMPPVNPRDLPPLYSSDGRDASPPPELVAQFVAAMSLAKNAARGHSLPTSGGDALLVPTNPIIEPPIVVASPRAGLSERAKRAGRLLLRDPKAFVKVVIRKLVKL